MLSQAPCYQELRAYMFWDSRNCIPHAVNDMLFALLNENSEPMRSKQNNIPMNMARWDLAAEFDQRLLKPGKVALPSPAFTTACV